MARSLEDITQSPVPRPSNPYAANHQPNSRFEFGGRSPTKSVLLVPSVMLAMATFEPINRTPSSEVEVVPELPRYVVRAWSYPGRPIDAPETTWVPRESAGQV